MHETRAQIVGLLRQSARTVPELKNLLGISAMTVRHHLQFLQREGLVRAPQTVRRAAPGRPRFAYQLSPKAAADTPKEFAALAGHLIDAIKSAAGNAEKVFSELVNKLSAELPCAAQTATIESRLDGAAIFLSTKGYVASWEQSAAGPLLHTNNCPYDGLAGQHPELCKMDLELITRVTGADVKRVCHAPQGDATCSYLIMPAIGAVQAAG